MKKIRVNLNLILAFLLFSLSLGGFPGLSGTAAAAEEALEQTEQSTEEEPGEKMKALPSVRPSYRALDYVDINDESYKHIPVSLYPAADSSEEAQSAYLTELDTAIMTRLYNLYPIKDYPEDLLFYVRGSLENAYRQYADMYGLDFGAFLYSYMNMDEETFLKETDEAARKTLHQEILLKAIAEKEDISLSDEDYERGLEEYAGKYGYDSTDSLKRAFDEETLRLSLLMDKTMEFLEDKADIEEIIETETEDGNLTATEAG